MTKDINSRKTKLAAARTYTVPAEFGEMNVRTNVNTKNNIKISKEEIINQAFKFHSQGEIIKAQKCYKYFIDKGYIDSRVFSNYGTNLKILGNYEDAVIFISKAIEINPDFAEAHLNLGTILHLLGRVEEAKISILKAIKLKSDFAEAFSNLGNLLADIGKLNDAESSLRQAIKIKPNYALAYQNLGNTLENLGRREEAKKCWIKAVELNPSLENSCIMLASILCFERKYELAINYISKNNSENCQSFYLGCLLSLDREKDFNTKYQELIDRKTCNANIGGIVEHANVIYNNNYKSPFCDNSMKYILWDKIDEELFSEEYCDQLIALVKNDTTILRSQSTLKEGVQTAGNLFLLDYPFIKSIKKALELKIELYKQKFINSGQGFIQYWPKNYELRSWMIVMKKGGFLEAHNHEYGWITGSFYLKVPKSYDNEEAGSLAFSYRGPRYPSKGESFNSIIKNIERRDLCIFPSSLFHHTIPFQSEEERICFVFDLVQ